MAYLIIMFKDQTMREVHVGDRPLRIGRDSSNDIHIDNPAVSRFHAEVYRQGYPYYIEDKKSTKGGIALPDNIEIPTITGRVVTVSAQVANDDDFPIRQYDKVLFNPKNSIPVDFEPGNQLFVVPIDDVVAVFRHRR